THRSPQNTRISGGAPSRRRRPLHPVVRRPAAYDAPAAWREYRRAKGTVWSCDCGDQILEGRSFAPHPGFDRVRSWTALHASISREHQAAGFWEPPCECAFGTGAHPLDTSLYLRLVPKPEAPRTGMLSFMDHGRCHSRRSGSRVLQPIDVDLTE